MKARNGTGFSGEIRTVSEVGAGVNFPNDLSLVGAIDAAVLIVQKVLGQQLI